MGVNDFEHIKVLFHPLNLLLIIIVVVSPFQITAFKVEENSRTFQDCANPGFIAMHETVHLVKFMGKGCSIFFNCLLCYLVLQDIKYTKVFIPDSYGLPGHTTTAQTYTISSLCQCWCAFHLRYSVTGL